MAQWKRSDGYSGCKTAYFGDLAVVICPPEFGSGWGYQAFDESNDEAVMYGEVEYEEYGFKSEAEVIEYVESVMSMPQ